MSGDELEDRFFSELIYAFKYEGLIRKLILDFKFNDKPYLYHMFCEIFVKNKFGCDFVKNYDIIILGEEIWS